ncbi:TenA family transcriptional regulator [Sorangium sp. So ce1667]
MLEPFLAQLGDSSVRRAFLFELNQILLREGVNYESWRHCLAHLLRARLACDDPIVKGGPTVTSAAEFRRKLDELLRTHHANNHPLFARIEAGGFGDREMRVLIGNYLPIAKVFHLAVAGLLYHVPLRYRAELSVNLYEEMGGGKLEKSHPMKYQVLADKMRLREFVPNDESLNFVNQLIRVFKFSTPAIGMGAYTALEVEVANQLGIVGRRLKELGYIEQNVEFFDEHAEIDVGHADVMLELVGEYAAETRSYDAILSGARFMLDARAEFFDGVLRDTSNDQAGE